MTYGNYENNLLSVLTFASTRSTWVSVASCVERCGISYDLVDWYLSQDCFSQVAAHYRYDYRIRMRGSRGGTKLYISVVSRGYA